MTVADVDLGSLEFWGQLEAGEPEMFRSSSFIHGVKRMSCSFRPRA